MPTEFNQLVGKIAGIFKELEINYCITGGYAVSAWGRPRSTFDIDLIIELTSDKIKPLLKKLRKLSKAGYIDEAATGDAVALGGEFNYVHSDTGIKIDFWVIGKKDKIGQEELKRRIAKKIGGQKIYFISPEDLILGKLRWYKESQSTRHLEDIESVLKFSTIDKKYLKQQAAKQSVLEIFSDNFSIFNKKQ